MNVEISKPPRAVTWHALPRGGITHARVLLIEDNPGDARPIREFIAESAGRAFKVEWATVSVPA